MFVTDVAALRAKLDTDGARVQPILDAIENAGHALVDIAGRRDQKAIMAAEVRARLAEHPDAEGVVVIGGYDVMPSFAVDTVPPDIAGSVDRQGDRPDGFVVWNDEVYGDTNGDGLAELPVSRAPDGGSVAFLAKVLGATTTTSTIDRSGVRNFARPFAELVFGALPGADPLLVSVPVLSDSPSFRLDGRMVYVMLHGDHHDTSQFEGEKENRQRVPAASLANVPTENAGVVLAGCCWGGLISDEIASECPPDKDPGQRSPENSMAMKFLEGGSIAFVGCTGLHYSPMKEPFDYNGRPMHESFWRHVLAGDAPAVALHKARDEFGAAIPHGQETAQRFAIESKIWRQFTCLGLGW